MGEAKARAATFEERRDLRLNEMVEQAEVMLTLRVDDKKKVVLSMLSRDDPPEQTSAAVAVAAFLSANWDALVGQALALHSVAMSGQAAAHPDLNGGITVLDARGMPASNEDGKQVFILGAGGGFISSQDKPSIELPASVAGQV